MEPTKSSPCFIGVQLMAQLMDKAPGASLQWVKHIAQCPTCQEASDEPGWINTLLRTLLVPPTPKPPTLEDLRQIQRDPTPIHDTSDLPATLDDTEPEGSVPLASATEISKFTMRQTHPVHTSPALFKRSNRVKRQVATQAVLMWLPRVKEAESAEVGYSPAVHQSTEYALRLIRRSRRHLDGYICAADLLTASLDKRMSRRQRLRMHYIFTLRYAASGDYQQALEWIATTMDQAVHLRDRYALASLHAIHGSMLRAQEKFNEAANTLGDGLLLLDDLEASDIGPTPWSRRFRLYMLSQLAVFRFFLARFEPAAHAISQAIELTPAVAGCEYEVATVEWMRAHLERLRGRPTEALAGSLRAASAYEHAANIVSRGRLEAFIAETALDVAETAWYTSDASQTADFIARAKPHLTRARQLASDSNDLPGHGLVTLAYARFTRLWGLNEDRLGAIEAVARLGQRMGDTALVAQAFTALGDELHARSETQGALNCYRDALNILDGSEVPVLGLRAQRALLLHKEMSGS